MGRMIEVARRTMQKGYVKRYFVYQIRDKALVLILGGTFLGGVIIGCRVAAGDSGQLSAVLQNLLGLNMTTGVEQNFLTYMTTAFTTNALLVAGLFICGFCAISQPLILFILFFKGLGFGLMGSYLYGLGQKSAIIYYSLVLLPEMLLSITILIVSSKEAFAFTKNFLQILIPTSQKDKTGIPVQAYCFRFLLYIILTGMISLIIALIKTTYYSVIS